MSKVNLPVDVLDGPHWRVNIRPTEYLPERISTLKECFELIEQNRVRLRGWDFPHMRRDRSECTQGANWIGCWSDFMGHVEYWRLYQSGQFVHLASFRELGEDWRAQLEKETRGHLSYLKDVNWSKVPGFLHIQNVIYTLTEVFEFASRLAQRGIYKGSIVIQITMRGIKEFVLTTDWNRAWHSYYRSTEEELERSIVLDADVLVAESSKQAIEMAVWFFERFGWHDAPLEIFKADQQEFLQRRR
jgi:hypothetical protein